MHFLDSQSQSLQFHSHINNIIQKVAEQGFIYIVIMKTLIMFEMCSVTASKYHYRHLQIN